jgi:hypothetical protein
LKTKSLPAHIASYLRFVNKPPNYPIASADFIEDYQSIYGRFVSFLEKSFDFKKMTVLSRHGSDCPSRLDRKRYATLHGALPDDHCDLPACQLQPTCGHTEAACVPKQRKHRARLE